LLPMRRTRSLGPWLTPVAISRSHRAQCYFRRSASTRSAVGEPVPGTDDTATWLTQEAHDRLSKELAELIANRPVIAKEINDRREEGDLRENGATRPRARSRPS